MSEQPAGEIVLYQRGDAPAIDVRLEGDTVWLSQEATCREFRQVRTAIACHQEALAHTEVEYTKFRTQQAAQPSEVETVFLETVKQVQKKIEGKSIPAPGSKKGRRDE